MAYRLFAKSPVQMRREAEARGKPRRRERRPGPLDPARRPVLDGANFAALRTRAPVAGFAPSLRRLVKFRRPPSSRKTATHHETLVTLDVAASGGANARARFLLKFNSLTRVQSGHNSAPKRHDIRLGRGAMPREFDFWRIRSEELG